MDEYATGGHNPFVVNAGVGVLANDHGGPGGPLSAKLMFPAYSGAVSSSADGSFVYTPNAGFTGYDSFGHAATAGGLTANVQINIPATTPPVGSPTFTWTQSPPIMPTELNPGAPTGTGGQTATPPLTLINPGDKSNNAGDAVGFQLVGNGPAGDGLAYSADGLPTGLAVDPTLGFLSGTIDPSASASNGVTVTVTDTFTGATASQTFAWAVTTASPPAYVAPAIDPIADQASAAGSTVDLAVSASGSGTLAFTVAGLPTGLAIDTASGGITGTPTVQGSYVVTVAASDGTSTATRTFNWSVQPATIPTGPIPIVVVPAPFAATEGNDTGNVSVATFTADPASDPADYAATIAWGDGTTDQGVIDGRGGAFTVSGDHTYAASGILATSVTVTGLEGTTATGSGMETVSAATVTPIAGFQEGIVIGQSGELVTEFTYGNPMATATGFSAVIDPGDGTGSVTGNIASLGGALYSMSLSHAYAHVGGYSATVTITDPHGMQTTTVGTEEVGDIFATLPATLTVATFDLGDPTAMASAYTAKIVWGDGSAPRFGTVSGSAGHFTVQGDHDYLVDSIGAAGGSYQVTVTLSTPGKPDVTAKHPVVATRPPMAGQMANVAENMDGTVPMQPVAMFEVPDTTDAASWFATTIDWGDGSTSAGTISGGGGLFTVAGGHVYGDSGQHFLRVTVSQGWNNVLPVLALIGSADRHAPDKTALSNPPNIVPSGPAGDDLFLPVADDGLNTSVKGLTVTATPITYAKNGEEVRVASLQIKAHLSGYASWAAAYKDLGIDHLNFYQYAVVTKGDAAVTNDIGWMVGGKFVPIGKQPFVDLPIGGLYQRTDAKVNINTWSGNLPWYYDEASPSAGVTKVSWTPNLTIQKLWPGPATNTIGNFGDAPRFTSKNAIEIKFYAWLVGVDAKGVFQKWFQGFAWNYTQNGDIS